MSGDTILAAVGPRRIEVIKAVREMTPLEFEDARHLVDSTPSIVATQLSAESAHFIRVRLQRVGAATTIGRHV
ncbi:ribosomal protein L7/L12 [Nocardioides sp. Iso805N]|uniref:ribosomal protein L7/L12 n=1 Tax=Nocardioides sp. Iso805N TaxID=1283287 RepID=UPI000371C05B|nr:ribosomal protein L7/L12 [Nocardioides sp. Iso805N]